ncbi:MULTISPECIES: hypothetical protein [unclassified Paenibacillus]|uniref:DUF4025 domain-containing protein n=1 Tax=Paenibacillus provencensis TaxID=441151 RepID=A0ABW3PUD7_9BACL|nr:MULTISPECIES: hypothetical protein [unclassified Paenibacillus]MCM3127788.1 hypothetical protein [Paenibacillus sp. MER 78]SFS37922.1 hypothetical protein SAMN04488601_101176 [Paenibacillus sp. 453mf]
MDNKPHTSEADFAYDRYRSLQEPDPLNTVPEDDLDYVNTYTEQTISLDEDTTPLDAETVQKETMQDVRSSSSIEFAADEDFMDRQDVIVRSSEPDLTSVPDADDIEANSPVDPAAPDPDAMHGTDLINGAGGDSEK